MDGVFHGNPMNKWMIWGVLPPLFLVQHPYGSIKLPIQLGGAFKHFWKFHPDPWGFMIQFDEFFRMGGKKPPTRRTSYLI